MSSFYSTILGALSWFGLILGTAVSALGASGGEAEFIYNHVVPHSSEVEHCYVPAHYQAAGLSYNDPVSGENPDREMEIKLCSYSMYSGTSGYTTVQKGEASELPLPQSIKGKEVLACPKFSSTNPGTNLVAVPKGMSYESAAKAYCVPKSKIASQYREDYDVVAKFKSTISCSATPSILGYYHLSRMLGGAGRVPVAVLRTFSRKSHRTVAESALSYFSSGSKELIAINWRNFLSASDSAAKGRPNSKLFTEDGRALFGALQKNVKGEDRYTEVSGVGSYDTRYERFIKQRPFLLVADSRPIAGILAAAASGGGASNFSTAAQTIVQMQDVSDMVLMDTLMAQDDRIGNIHVKAMVLEQGAEKLRAFTKEEKKVFELYRKQELAAARKKNSKVSTIPVTSQMAQRASASMFPRGEAAVVAAMYLKDNDCGVDVDSRGNQMRKVSALEAVRHMNPETYRRFLKFAVEVDSERFQSFAVNALQYRVKDYEGTRNSLRENTRHAAQVLIKACESGQLKLDLKLKFDSAGRLIPAEPMMCR